MKADTVFVAFLSVVDGRHDAFLDWHELDHRPENHGAIEHIYHSERFIAAPDALARRHLADEDPFRDLGQYLMMYWSTAPPDQVTFDMAVLREQLAALGRCAPIGRDFRAAWRERMHLAKGYANPAHIASAEAAYLTNHRELVVTIGHYGPDPSWQQYYDREGIAALFDDERITAAYTLMPRISAIGDPFVHLHYVRTGPGAEPVQDVIARAYASGAAALPSVLYRCTYQAQHAGEPRYYT